MTNPLGLSDERYAKQRSSMIARRTDLRRVEAEAVAWSELGFSRSGIARRMETNESTVKSYHERAMALCGFEMLEFYVTTDGDLPEYDRVEPGYHRRRHANDQQLWVDLVDQQRRGFAQEWVTVVLEAAEADGVTPTTS
jgi:DNA-binding CsgD family transcriptional regulator